MEQILGIVMILLKFFLDPERVKKREEEKIEKERDELKHEIDEHLRELDATSIASDIDMLLRT